MCLRTSENSYTIGTGFGRIVAISVGLPLGQVSERSCRANVRATQLHVSCPSLLLRSYNEIIYVFRWYYQFPISQIFFEPTESNRVEGERETEKERKRVSEYLGVSRTLATGNNDLPSFPRDQYANTTEYYVTGVRLGRSSGSGSCSFLPRSK